MRRWSQLPSWLHLINSRLHEVFQHVVLEWYPQRKSCGLAWSSAQLIRARKPGSSTTLYACRSLAIMTAVFSVISFCFGWSASNGEEQDEEPVSPTWNNVCCFALGLCCVALSLLLWRLFFSATSTFFNFSNSTWWVTWFVLRCTRKLVVLPEDENTAGFIKTFWHYLQEVKQTSKIGDRILKSRWIVVNIGMEVN